MQGIELAAEAQSNDGGGLLGMIFPFLLVAVVFYFLLLRPQQKRRQRDSQMQSSLGIGNEVMTHAGIFGTVTSVDDDTVELEISPGTRIKMLKAGIRDVLTPPEPGAGAEPDYSDTPVEDRPDFPTQRSDGDDPGKGDNDPRP
ncbi:protein translocase subunit yajC [Murinocardiopsis flavida]|uniref:Protein translocase subunit yajC n=1 Tax=Murinocardiopsis flavida TaxID=645275 RepID=A0A2P8DKC3_9ACTN|nr:preprotein translocase subunit YajC [Murinocardiopsis flavida]PSK97659.1 protein translocase subunit yajC [Murinocardiopsis flavida]